MERLSLLPKTVDLANQMENRLDWLTDMTLKSDVILNSPAQFQAMKVYFSSPSKDAGVSCRAGHSDISIDPQGRIRLCYFWTRVIYTRRNLCRRYGTII